MDTTRYAPIRSSRLGSQSVTNMNWCCGGSKSSADNYATYEISVFKHWYVYRHKPKWFGQYKGDRYLGKLRWISQHADGKQHKWLIQRGDLDRVKVEAGSEKESDRIAHELMLTRGYLAFYLSHLRRECDWYLPRGRTKEIRCTSCHLTKAEAIRKKDAYTWDLMYPKDNSGDRDYHRRMDHWDAQQRSRVYATCCGTPSPVELDALAYSLSTGEGLRLD